MFNRNCKEALEMYEKAFDAKISEMQKYGDMPPNPAFPIAESDKDLVLHARLNINGEELMCADASSQNSSGDNMYISMTTNDAAFVQKAWVGL
jgi:PhnB protein